LLNQLFDTLKGLLMQGYFTKGEKTYGSYRMTFDHHYVAACGF
jgi:hypothetical protein